MTIKKFPILLCEDKALEGLSYKYHQAKINLDEARCSTELRPRSNDRRPTLAGIGEQQRGHSVQQQHARFPISK